MWENKPAHRRKQRPTEVSSLYGLLSRGYPPSMLERFFDGLLEAELTALLVFATAAFGTVEPWSEQHVVGLGGLLAATFAAKMALCPRERLVRTWAYAPVAAFLALVALQLAPLPAGLVDLVSPQAAERWKQAVGAGSFPLTLYPFGTAHDLRLLLVVATVFFVTLNTMRRPEQIRRMLGIIAGLGVAVATVFFVQRAVGAEKVYGLYTMSHAPSGGPFVNSNHFAQFMNGALGATVGLFLVKSSEVLPSDPTTRAATPPTALVARASPQDLTLMGLLFGVMVAGALAVALSLSRGGVVAMTVAGLAVFGLLGVRERGHLGTTAAAVGAVATFGLLLTTGFEVVFEDFLSLGRRVTLNMRWDELRDLLRMFADFPVVGAGQGSLEVVYPIYQQTRTTLHVWQADVYYPQILAETGAVGFLLVLAFLAIVGVRFFRATDPDRPDVGEGATGPGSRRAPGSLLHRGHGAGAGPDPRATPVAAYGLAFAVLGAVCQSAVDYGQRLPANAILTAISAALLVLLGRRDEDDPSWQSPGAAPDAHAERTGGAAGSRRRELLRRGLRGVALAATVAVGVVLFAEAHDVAAAASHAERAEALDHRIEADWPGITEDHRKAIRQAKRAAALAPGNPEHRLRSVRYQWRATLLWSWAKRQDTDGRVAPQTVEKFRVKAGRLLERLRKARRVAPTKARLYSLAGEIHWLSGNKEAAAPLIRYGFRLDRNHPRTAILAGVLAAEQQRWDTALRRMRRAATLEGHRFDQALWLLVDHLDRPRLALELAGKSVKRLSRVRQRLKEDHPKIARLARQRIHRIRTRKAEQGEASANTLVALAKRAADRGDHAKAVDYYKRALRGHFAQVGWRLALARSLEERGKLRAAKKQLEICHRLKPDDAEIRKRLEDVVVRIGPRASDS